MMIKVLLAACFVVGAWVSLSDEAGAQPADKACLQRCSAQREELVKVCQRQPGLGNCYTQHNIVEIYGACKGNCLPNRRGNYVPNIR
jgi:hypothetical protein